MGDAVVKEYLQDVEHISSNKVLLDGFIDKSLHFDKDFPSNNARLHKLKQRGVDASKLEDVINSTYPLIHERVIRLIVNFIEYKKKRGNRNERDLYANMTLMKFVERMLKFRPVSFYGAQDKYMLYNFKQGRGNFDKIGTADENPPFILKDYMCYDEMKIASLFSISSESFFINDGSRDNRGNLGSPGTYTEHGVILAQVGTRLKKEGVMEWQDCIISPHQNTKDNGYGSRPEGLPRLWSSFYEKTLPAYEETKSPVNRGRYPTVNIRGKKGEGPRQFLFNHEIFMERTRVVAETLLIDANSRAGKIRKKAYIHVVGLGLGVWRLEDYQEQMYVDAWGEALKNVDTSNISDVNFSWIDVRECLGKGNGCELNNVTIHFSKRSLHDPVPERKLLVCNFAWDSNSYPGNEFWFGQLDKTGDGAAACSSGVAELHNCSINDKVSQENLHVATNRGVLHISDYARMLLNDRVINENISSRNVSNNSKLSLVEHSSSSNSINSHKKSRDSDDENTSTDKSNSAKKKKKKSKKPKKPENKIIEVEYDCVDFSKL